MRRFEPDLPLLLPTVRQVIWRSGCPPDSAGPEVTSAAESAVACLSSISSAWCGAVLFEAVEIPEFASAFLTDVPVSVMAATLGRDVSSLLEEHPGLPGFMIDSAASVAIESYLKAFQISLAESLQMTPTKRYAPGYGDMPLSVQREIIGMFPNSGIGCTDEFMLSPVKSMTGVVGWIQLEN